MNELKLSKLYLQDPTDTDSYSLHEALLSACNDAQLGGGMFSFVTQGGVQLLLEDEAFLSFMDRSHFELIVGIDEVTNPRALSRLKDLSSAKTNFIVSAFLHEGHRSLFHPKFCWFKTESGGRLVIGSGNLTFSGLRNNWEAYTIVELNAAELSSIQSNWVHWCDLHSDELKPVDDTDVVKKAKLNVIRRKVSILEETETVEQSLEEEHELEEIIETREDSILWEFKDSDKVLVAEIPKSGNRWNQANFDKESFENFFGAKRGNDNQRILLRSVDSDGKLGNLESRQSVSVISNNHRFELGAAAGLEYPDNGVPIGIFIKIAKRVFLYCLVMPGDKAYQDTLNALSSRWTSREDRKKRVVIDLVALKESARDLPLWKRYQD